MKILVTGTAGFIGMHVAQELLAQGHQIVGIDNFNDYYQVSLKRDRWARIEGHENFRGVEMNFVDGDALNALFAEEKFDRVCHLAAQAGVRYSLENPHVYQETNLHGFLNILEACRHNEIPRLVYASSSSVYGGNKEMPFTEKDNVDRPISLYAATKKANELMAHAYSHLYGFEAVGLRFFTVYGPWGRPDMALWLFAKAMANGDSFDVFNNGDMQRDFTYIDDIVQGTIASIFAEGLDRFEVFNLGNHTPERLMDMIQTLADAMGVEPKMNMLPMQPGDVPATYANIDHAKAKLGYEPTTPIKVGIPQFAEWFKSYHS